VIESLPVSYRCHKQTYHGCVVDIACSKAVTRGVFLVFEHPPKFQGKIRHTKTDLLLVKIFKSDHWISAIYPCLW